MTETEHVIRFGVFEADLEAGELRRNGAKLKLQEQPFQVLAALLEKPGAVVTKEELQRRIWNGDTFVDFDRSLATAVNKIRQALGDSATRPRFVETVPKKGYRFIGGAEGRSPLNGDAYGEPEVRRRFTPAWIAATVVAALLGGIVVARVVNRPSLPATLLATPLTSDAGYELWPSFSPDGEYLAFAAGDPLGKNLDVYRMHLESRERIPITTDPRLEYSPTWSPDGNSIAFLRDHGAGRFGVYVTSPLGGHERLLTEVAATGVLLFADLRPTLAWTHDSANLLVADRPAEDEAYRLMRVAVKTGRKSLIANLPASESGSFDQVASPDGKGLVFKSDRMGDLQWADLIHGGAEASGMRYLTTGRIWMSSPAFGAEGVVFSAGDKFSRRLWQVDVQGRTARALGALADSGDHPAISPSGDRLVYAQPDHDFNVWLLELDEHRKLVGKRRIASSTRFDGNAALSPDGKRVALESNRSGFVEVWICEVEGSDCSQLTSLEAWSGSPKWSPDGNRIAFDSDVAGDFDVYVVDAAGGSPRAAAGGKGHDHSPSWSEDGRFLYFSSPRSGSAQLWRVRSDGREPTQVTTGGGRWGQTTLDALYFVRHGAGERRELWRLHLASGAEARVLDHVPRMNWASTSDGVYFVSETEGRLELRFEGFRSGTATSAGALDTPLYPQMDATPDGRFVLVTQVDRQGSDLMIVESFH